MIVQKPFVDYDNIFYYKKNISLCNPWQNWYKKLHSWTVLIDIGTELGYKAMNQFLKNSMGLECIMFFSCLFADEGRSEL